MKLLMLALAIMVLVLICLFQRQKSSKAQMTSVQTIPPKTVYDKAFDFLLENEGGLNCHKYDKGGLTKYGISKVFLINERIDVNNDGKIDDMDVQDLTLEEAKHLYKTYFWDRMGLDGLYDTRLSVKLFDAAVNMGTVTAVKLLQKSLRCVDVLEVDGIVGSKTLAILNNLSNDEKDIVYQAFIALWKGKYVSICSYNTHFRVFIKGWLRRAARRVDG